MATKFTIPTKYDKVQWFDESDGLWKDLSSTKHAFLAQRVEIPVAVKRPFPTDPFASATTRVVTKYDLWAPVTSFQLRRWTYRGPLSSVYQTGSWGSSASFSHTVCDQKLRASIKSQVMNVLQSAAEVPQTTAMVRKLIMDVRTGFRALRPGFAFANIASALLHPRNKHDKAMANRWLEMQYGWKPALQDIYGAASALSTKVNEGFPQYVQASSRVDFDEAREVSATFDGGTYSYVKTHRQTVSLRSKARFVVKSSNLKTLSQLGITNPALLAWELIPCSFVVDQILPIGNWLSSLDALVGVEGLVVSRSYLNENDYISSGAFGATLYRTESKVRLGTSGDLAIGWPSPKPTNSMLSLANDLALLTQLRRHL